MVDGTKPAKETPAWLLTADRYVAEIAEAERIEALAAAATERPKVGPASMSKPPRPRMVAKAELAGRGPATPA